MDIKERIQDLTLDQKAKLYFMGLVRQGKIDRLPEDPKAAYIKDMMGKMDTIQKISPKVDRSSLEKLTGMATELGYLKEITISRGIEVEVTGNNIMVNGSPLRRINVATVGFSDRIYRGYLFTDEGQINLDGGESGLFEFYDAVGAGRGAEAREFFEKYGVEIMSSEFDVS